jgi:hypothetical protein
VDKQERADLRIAAYGLPPGFYMISLRMDACMDMSYK